MGLRNVLSSSLVRCYIHFRKEIREEQGSSVLQDFTVVSKVI